VYEIDTPLLDKLVASEAEPSAFAVKPVAPEQVATSVGATVAAAHESETVAARVGAGEAHSYVAAAGHVRTGGGAVTVTVSLQVAELPAESVAVQTIVLPLLAKSAAIVTLPSALTVQPVQPAGQAHATVGVVQTSEPVAETVMGPELHCAVDAEMAHWMVGGVVSTTVMELVQLQLGPHAEVAEHDTARPLLAIASATVTEPSALAT